MSTVPQLTYASFVALFPEFGNVAQYPQASFEAWLPWAYLQLNVARFGLQAPLAAAYYIGHHMVLGARNAASAATGQIVGQQQGITTAKAVGDVSISYDAASALNKDAGFWNQTSYGSQLFQMIQSFGVGPNYVPGPVPLSGSPYGLSPYAFFGTRRFR